MKQSVFVILLFFSISNAIGQGAVEIIVEPEVKKAEEVLIQYRKEITKLVGFRIQLGVYSNRGEANTASNVYINAFGGTATPNYDEPNWKIFVGEFATKAEAELELKKIRKRFPNARIVQAALNMSLADKERQEQERKNTENAE